MAWPRNPLDPCERSKADSEGAAVARLPGETVFLQVFASRLGPDISKV